MCISHHFHIIWCRDLKICIQGYFGVIFQKIDLVLFLTQAVSQFVTQTTKIITSKKFGHSGPPFGAFSNSPFPHSRVKKISLKKTKSKFLKIWPQWPPFRNIFKFPLPAYQDLKVWARKKFAEKVGIQVSFILMRPHLPWERKFHFNNMILDN